MRGSAKGRTCKKHYFEPGKRRLFITHCTQQAIELKRLFGKGRIRFVNIAWVTYQRAHHPFSDEINLQRS